MTHHSWHTLEKEVVLEHLNSTVDGLATDEASRRITVYGRNVLPTGRKATLLTTFLHQFKSPLIYVLLAAAAISIILSEYSDAGFIFLILLINATIGTIQEWSAETKASALQDMIRRSVKTKRDGRVVEVDSEDLVPGDIIFLESGNKIPADIRAMSTNNVAVEEAILTGESMATEKKSDVLTEEGISLAERRNMMYAGTTVTRGRATGIVVATGPTTEIGKIASSLSALTTGKAPLVERMEAFSRSISLFVLLGCLLLGVIGYVNGIGIVDIFLFVVAVAVSAIPEGLPIAMTVALSIGASRMAKRNVIIRKLPAVEGLGSCTFIATDKTGTLTVDQQTVRKIVLGDGSSFDVTGEGYNGEGKIVDRHGNKMGYGDHDGLDALIAAVTICNEGNLEKNGASWMFSGDPIDIAMLSLSWKAGTTPDSITRAAEPLKVIPFEPERQYGAICYRDDQDIKIAAKGAFEKIALNALAEQRETILPMATDFASGGFRVIAVGRSKVDEIMVGDELPNVELLGFVALIDPLRKEAKPAVEECHAAGVDVAMITGDHPATALSIAKQVGIASDESQLISGVELQQAIARGDDAFKTLLDHKRVFSRVSPHQKQLIVEALREKGHFIAVTGDGVNDAPALKSANIGVAMGYGTDVAKDTASIILRDNNFASISAGIEEGRFAYANLRKIIYLLISTGAAELMMIALSLSFRLPLPFLPVQLLWLNLVTNGLQDIGLAFEAGEKGVMRDPPRNPKETIFNALMLRETLLSAAVITLLTFGLWYHLLNHLGREESEARNIILLLMVLLQNFHTINCRSETASVFRIPLKNNVVLLAGIAAAQGVHILAMHIPFTQQLLGLRPVSMEDWLKLFATASIIVIVMEVFKSMNRKRGVERIRS